MTACSVTCHDCGTNGIPKVWNHLCEDCARSQRDEHRLDTGHDPQLYIAPEVSIQIIQRDFDRAHRLMTRRRGW